MYEQEEELIMCYQTLASQLKEQHDKCEYKAYKDALRFSMHHLWHKASLMQSGLDAKKFHDTWGDVGQLKQGVKI